MALVDNSISNDSSAAVVICASNEVAELFPVESMDVPTSLAHQFISKLRSRSATTTDLERAERLFRGIRFEDYEERCVARLMTFGKENSDEVIEKFCKSHKFTEDTAEGLKFAAAMLDTDRSAETWIKFQKGEEGEFFVNFVAMRRIGEKIHMGLARHQVKFKLAPFAYESGNHEYEFYSWWNHFGNGNGTGKYSTAADGNTAKPQEPQSLSLEEVTLLENLFLMKAMKKFTEDFPANANRLPYEDRPYLKYK